MRELRHSLHVVLPLGLLICTHLAFGQEALDRLEKKIDAQKAAEAKVKPELADPKAEVPKGAEPGYLGVVTDDADDRGRGVRVTEIIKGSPAEAAGLKLGDLITAIDGQPVRQMSDVPQRLKGAVVGSKLGITLVRDGETRTIHATLGRRPQDAKLPPPPPPEIGKPGARAPRELPPPPEKPRPPAAEPRPAGGAPGMLGIVMRSHADDPRFVLGRTPIRGVIVTQVLPESPAGAAGLRAGDIIVALDDQETGDRDQLRAAMSGRSAGEEVELTFYRGRLLIKQKVRLAAAVPLDGPGLDRPPEGRLGPIPPRPPLELEAGGTDQRIEALERRVRELERRLEELEKKSNPAP